MNDVENAARADTELIAAVEAVLFAAGEPVHPKEIAQAFESADEDAVREAIEALAARFLDGPGGLVVEQVAGAYRLATKPAVGGLVRLFFRQRNRTRLSPAGLETLAIVAYRQPVSAPEVQAIRGVDPSGALKGLLEKKMIRILGRKKVVGNPLLYGTTRQFLMHFGLNRLEDLPSIAEFDEYLGTLAAAPAEPVEGGIPGPPPDEEAVGVESLQDSEEE